MTTKNKYTEIINLFLPENNMPNVEIWQETPFNAMGRTMATNRMALAIEPEIGL